MKMKQYNWNILYARGGHAVGLLIVATSGECKHIASWNEKFLSKPGETISNGSKH